DLEVEGYGARIAELLRSDGPYFHDFKGDEIAARRRYFELELEPALQRFESARATNISRLRSATPEQRAHRATQEGLAGDISLQRIAQMMAEHDASHTAEIAQILETSGR